MNTQISVHRSCANRRGAGYFDAKIFLRNLTIGSLSVLLASLVRAFVSPDQFETFFGPTLPGLWVTIVVVTILGVCAVGSTPIAADILTRAWSTSKQLCGSDGWRLYRLHRNHGAARYHPILEGRAVLASDYAPRDNSPGLGNHSLYRLKRA
jgi:hypothetical protein